MSTALGLAAAFEPHVHQVDQVTLSGAPSQKPKLSLPNGDTSQKNTSDPKHEASAEVQPKAHRRNLVFADPVAFR